MKGIEKNSPPADFERWKTEVLPENPENYDWDDLGKKRKGLFKKNTLRAALLEEQGYICCYCCRRIENRGQDEQNKNAAFTVVEHFKPKDKKQFPELTFDYGNLFASCDGGRSYEQSDNNAEDGAIKPCHCDNSKNNFGFEDGLPEIISPTEKKDTVFLCENAFIFHADGGVSPKNALDGRAERTCSILKLNDRKLKKERLDAVDVIFPEFKDPSLEPVFFTADEKTAYLAHYKSKHNGRFEPCCDAVLWFLENYA